jgi:Uma2 family endonuclease
MAITDFSQLDLTKQYTWSDYLSWQFKERVELLRGYVAKMSPAPASKHQVIVGNIYLELGIYLRKKLCQLCISPFDVYLPIKGKNTVVQPDLFIVCDNSKIQKKGCVGAPDLVIEILSPGNSKREIEDKYDLYEESGVKEYWLVYPSEQVIQVYSLENGKYQAQKPLSNGGKVKSDLLPNFELDIDSIFEGLPED